jgi:hypothetical protein
MSKGDAAHASKHIHGVQPGNAGTVDFPVNARIAGLETRVDSLERRLEAVAPAPNLEVVGETEEQQSAAEQQVLADEQAVANDQKKLETDEAAIKAAKRMKN